MSENVNSAEAGVATVEPFEEVVFDAARAAEGLPPWRNTDGTRFYLSEEVERTVRNGVCLLCGSGVLMPGREHIRTDLAPCYP